MAQAFCEVYRFKSLMHGIGLRAELGKHARFANRRCLNFLLQQNLLCPFLALANKRLYATVSRLLIFRGVQTH